MGKRKVNDKDMIVLVLNRDHFKLLQRPEQGWTEELNIAIPMIPEGIRAGTRDGRSEGGEVRQEERE